MEPPELPDEATTNVDIAADAASDVAVGGSVGGGHDDPAPTAAAVASSNIKNSGASPVQQQTSNNPPGSAAAWGAMTDNLNNCSNNNKLINVQTKHRLYRKRALSSATSGTIDTNASMNNNNGAVASSSNDNAMGTDYNGLPNLPSSGISVMNMPLGTNTSSVVGGGSGGEQSIVSFGINFNFDSTSSPSTSDSGEGAVNSEKGGEGESSNSEDDNGERGKGKKAKVAAHPSATAPLASGEAKKKSASKAKNPTSNEVTAAKSGKKSAAGGSDEDKNSGSSSNKKAKKSKQSTTNNNGEAADSSDSSKDYNSGGSAASSGGSNSGNDGSSGGKSTISSLTTSSNQEWMAANERTLAASHAVAAVAAGGGNGASGEGTGAGASCSLSCAIRMNRVVHTLTSSALRPTLTDGKLKAVKKDGNVNSSSNKKRKKAYKATQGKSGDGNAAAANDENSTGGYNTDEEQWGAARNGQSNHASSGPAVAHKHARTKTGASPLTSKAASAEKEGPPLKQARFSIDQHPGLPTISSTMGTVPSAETSAQMALSSLSSDTPIPAAKAASGRPHLPSSSTTALVTSSSNNVSSSGGKSFSSPDQVRSAIRRGNGGKSHPATQDPTKRQERNAREKERSCRIAKQIDDLRSLLSRGGVVVAKGTKSSVLAEAANYINVLQQQQVQWEMDRQALVRQMQEVGATPDMAQIQQQGVIPMNPNSIAQVQQAASGVPGAMTMNPSTMGPNDYKFVFNNSSVGMVSVLRDLLNLILGFVLFHCLI